MKEKPIHQQQSLEDLIFRLQKSVCVNKLLNLHVTITMATCKFKKKGESKNCVHLRNWSISKAIKKRIDITSPFFRLSNIRLFKKIHVTYVWL